MEANKGAEVAKYANISDVVKINVVSGLNNNWVVLKEEVILLPIDTHKKEEGYI